jgi:hypothetical protein
MHPPPKQREFPTLALGETYNTRIANLRTTLARADITLRVAGVDSTFETAACTEGGSGCVRCELADQGTPVDGAVIEAATRVFQTYPTAMLLAAKIDHVAMCKEITYPHDGDVALPEHPAGLADLRGRGMLLSVKDFLNETYHASADFTMDGIVHHELYHLFDFQDLGGDMMTDTEWVLFNPLGFEYGAMAALAGGPRREGFIDAYATTNPAEDKASTYEWMMAHPEELCAIARIDETIRVKTRIIRRRVLGAVGSDAFIRAAAPCIDWFEP